MHTFTPERSGPDRKMKKVVVDEAFGSAVEFENGAIVALEATRFTVGRTNANYFEINGEKGSFCCILKRLNEMQVFWVGELPDETNGFRDVMVRESYHPLRANWWSQGHMNGWDPLFIHKLTYLLDANVNDKEIVPDGVVYEDGYKKRSHL